MRKVMDPDVVELAKKLHRNFLKKNQNATPRDWHDFYGQAASFLGKVEANPMSEIISRIFNATR